MKNKKVLITGGIGFIGSNLARKLVKMEAKVTVIDSLIPEYGGNLRNLHGIEDKLTINFSDVRDPFSMNQIVKGYDYLFNLAGQTSHLDSMKNPLNDLEINAKAQLSILESCRRHNPGIRIVYASTRQIYGKPKYLPVDENHPWHPVDINGVNKMAGEWYHIVYNDVYGISSKVLRLTNTYGPGMRIKDARQTFLGIWIRNVLEGKPIQVFGCGTQRRDYNYVEDVVDALLLAATSSGGSGKIYNLGGADPLSLEQTAQKICNLVDQSSYEMIPFPQDRKAIDVGDFVCNYELFEKTFNWSPKIRFEEGIDKSINFFKKELAHYI